MKLTKKHKKLCKIHYKILKKLNKNILPSNKNLYINVRTLNKRLIELKEYGFIDFDLVKTDFGYGDIPINIRILEDGKKEIKLNRLIVVTIIKFIKRILIILVGFILLIIILFFISSYKEKDIHLNQETIKNTVKNYNASEEFYNHTYAFKNFGINGKHYSVNGNCAGIALTEMLLYNYKNRPNIMKKILIGKYNGVKYDLSKNIELKTDKLDLYKIKDKEFANKTMIPYTADIIYLLYEKFFNYRNYIKYSNGNEYIKKNALSMNKLHHEKQFVNFIAYYQNKANNEIKRQKNINNIITINLINKLKKIISDNKQVVYVAINGEQEGHAVVGFSLNHLDDGGYEIEIADSNYPLGIYYTGFSLGKLYFYNYKNKNSQENSFITKKFPVIILEPISYTSTFNFIIRTRDGVPYAKYNIYYIKFYQSSLDKNNIPSMKLITP